MKHVRWLPVRTVARSLLVTGTLLALLLGGCATLPEPDGYSRLVDEQVAGKVAWSEIDGGAQTAFLDDLIDSDSLDDLIRQSLKENPGLQSTLLTLDVRRAQLRERDGTQLPVLEAAIDGNREENADAQFTGALSISWEVDVWQRIADGVRAAELDVAEQAALSQSVRDTLVGEVMKGWLALTALQHDLEINQRRLETQELYADFILQRYRNGLGDLEDLDSARSSAAETRADIEAAREALWRQQRDLSVLLGRSGETDIDPADTYPGVSIPLVDLPDQTLARRPDLKAAYLAVQAAESRAAAAYKDLLPSLSLRAALTDSGDSLQDGLLANPVWSLLGQLTAPLFQGGQLRAAADVADLQVAIAYQEYRQTLLDAVAEVETAIRFEKSLAKRQQHVEQALEMARNNLVQYQQRYRGGLVSILDLLEVQQQTYDLEARFDNLVYQRLSNRVGLGMALGLGVSDALQPTDNNDNRITIES